MKNKIIFHRKYKEKRSNLCHSLSNILMVRGWERKAKWFTHIPTQKLLLDIHTCMYKWYWYVNCCRMLVLRLWFPKHEIEWMKWWKLEWDGKELMTHCTNCTVLTNVYLLLNKLKMYHISVQTKMNLCQLVIWHSEIIKKLLLAEFKKQWL